MTLRELHGYTRDEWLSARSEVGERADEIGGTGDASARFARRGLYRAKRSPSQLRPASTTSAGTSAMTRRAIHRSTCWCASAMRCAFPQRPSSNQWALQSPVQRERRRRVYRNDRTILKFPSSNDWSSATSTERRRQTRQSKGTSSGRSTPSPAPRLPLIALCDEPLRSRVLRRAIERLEQLDTDQIQIAEIVIAAIARGQL